MNILLINNNKSPWKIITIGILLGFVVGFADYITGKEISFSVFYLLPIFLVTFLGSVLIGIIFSVISSLEWLIADLLSGHTYSHPLILYWNTLVRLIFFLIVVLILSKLQKSLKNEQNLSRRDPLTGTFNARYFEKNALIEINRSRRYDHPLTIAYLDLDNFKKVNDNFGHQIGDTLLKLLAETILNNTRIIDVVARMGGDEFVILFPETGYDAAKELIERLRIKFGELITTHKWPVTFSIGVVTFETPPIKVNQLIKEADDLMYVVKKRGKNQIEHHLIKRKC